MGHLEGFVFAHAVTVAGDSLVHMKCSHLYTTLTCPHHDSLVDSGRELTCPWWQCTWFQTATMWRVSPEMANLTATVQIAALAEVGWWKHEEIARVTHSCVKIPAPRSARSVPLLSCDGSCILAVCTDLMKAALAGSLLRISCGGTHGSSVGMWGLEADLAIWRC